MTRREDSIGIRIKTLSNLIKRQFEVMPSHASADSMTGMHGFLVGYLQQNQDHPIYQRELEQVFSIRRSTATGILQLMEKNGLITRQPVPQDARLKEIVLTEKARRLHDQIVRDMAQLERQMRLGFSPEELATLLALLDRMKQNLQQPGPGPATFDCCHTPEGGPAAPSNFREEDI